MIGRLPNQGILTGWKPSTVFTVPIVILKSRLDSPRPNIYNPMPLIPCSAFRVMLMKDISRPINRPTRAATSRPNHRLPVCKTAKKAAYALINIMPSTPRFTTPEVCEKVSPIAA